MKKKERENINIRSFIQNLEQQFNTPVLGGLQPEMLFRDLPEWTSLQALVVIVSFNDEYEVTITSDELRNANTVQDLFNLVAGKIQE